MGIPSYKNRVSMSVSGTPGTGTITLGSAEAGRQSFADAYGGNVNVDVVIEDGTAWEIARDCTYTHSGTTLSRGTLEASSTGSAINLTSSAKVYVTETAHRVQQGVNLENTAGSDANTSMVVGAMYVVDMSAWATADRTYTLPGTAAVGDRVGVMVSAGNASHELLITASSGDTLNGISGGTEWSRLFITGEVVIMRCVAANATWVVEHDGRIPQSAKITLDTAADGESASTYTRPTQASSAGAWIDEIDNANLTDAANDRIYVRRAGTYLIPCGYAPKDAGTAGHVCNIEIRKNGSTVLGGPSAVFTTSNVNRITAAILAKLAAGDYIDYYYRTQAGSLGAIGGNVLCTVGLTEVLP